VRKFALLAAASAGALFTILVQADAMTFSNKASALDILASADIVKPEQVRWCRTRNCGTRYHEPPPYYSGWSWYQPWPYYPWSYNYYTGTGQSNFGFAH
jgi:hypothetical protein